MLGGDIPSDELEGIFSHVDVCTPCQRRVQELAKGKLAADSIAHTLAGIDQRTDGQSLDQWAARRLWEVKQSLTSASSADGSGLHQRRLPRHLGQYELLRLVGRGGMAAVYEARHRRLGKRCAFKVLGFDQAVAPSDRTQIGSEWLAHGRLNHPHIVQATDAARSKESPTWLRSSWMVAICSG